MTRSRRPPATPPARRALACAGLLAACAGAPGFPEGALVDLSWAYDESTLYWPTDAEGFVLERGAEGYTEAGTWYAAHRFRTAEHGGTHVDAPLHFHEGGSAVDAIPLRRLVGPGVTVDVSAACARDRDHAVGVPELRGWEEEHGAIPDGAIVLLRTGFGARWPDRAAYLGTPERGPGAVAKLHFPGLDPDAARWLVHERRVRAVGIDTASIDPGTSRTFDAHRALARAGVPAFENLARLGELPARGFHLIALPMKIRGGSGGPLRVVAIVP
jgi:kynurenine formamidase